MFESLKFQIENLKIGRSIAAMPFSPYLLPKSLNLDIWNRIWSYLFMRGDLGNEPQPHARSICMYVEPCIYAEHIDMTARSQQLVNTIKPTYFEVLNTYSTLKPVNLISSGCF